MNESFFQALMRDPLVCCVEQEGEAPGGGGEPPPLFGDEPVPPMNADLLAEGGGQEGGAEPQGEPEGEPQAEPPAEPPPDQQRLQESLERRDREQFQKSMELKAQEERVAEQIRELKRINAALNPEEEPEPAEAVKAVESKVQELQKRLDESEKAREHAEAVAFEYGQIGTAVQQLGDAAPILASDFAKDPDGTKEAIFEIAKGEYRRTGKEPDYKDLVPLIEKNRTAAIFAEIERYYGVQSFKERLDALFSPDQKQPPAQKQQQQQGNRQAAFGSQQQQGLQGNMAREVQTEQQIMSMDDLEQQLQADIEALQRGESIAPK